MRSVNGWIGVDLDGTLATYSNWKDQGNRIGEAVPEMVERVRDWLAAGEDVRIFTARVAHDESGEQRHLIEVWCEDHLGEWLPITCCKDRHMDQLWDDRAIQVVRNQGTRVGTYFSMKDIPSE